MLVHLYPCENVSSKKNGWFKAAFMEASLCPAQRLAKTLGKPIWSLSQHVHWPFSRVFKMSWPGTRFTMYVPYTLKSLQKAVPEIISSLVACFFSLLLTLGVLLYACTTLATSIMGYFHYWKYWDMVWGLATTIANWGKIIWWEFLVKHNRLTDWYWQELAITWRPVVHHLLAGSVLKCLM